MLKHTLPALDFSWAITQNLPKKKKKSYHYWCYNSLHFNKKNCKCIWLFEIYWQILSRLHNDFCCI